MGLRKTDSSTARIAADRLPHNDRIPRGGRERLPIADAACILLAWEAGELSEGQAAKLLGLDRVSARARRQDMIKQGADLAR